MNFSDLDTRLVDFYKSKMSSTCQIEREMETSLAINEILLEK